MSEIYHPKFYDDVLAFDRYAHCTRVVPGYEAEVVNAYGDAVDCVKVNREKGYIIQSNAEFKQVKVLGDFRIVLSRAAEVKYNGNVASKVEKRSGRG